MRKNTGNCVILRAMARLGRGRPARGHGGHGARLLAMLPRSERMFAHRRRTSASEAAVDAHACRLAWYTASQPVTYRSARLAVGLVRSYPRHV